MTDLRSAAQQALEALETVFMPHHPAVIALREALAEEALQRLTDANQEIEAVLEQPEQTCNCRWVGDVQTQQCTLHEAHVDAIHEWAERAKAAEAKLAALEQPEQEPVAIKPPNPEGATQCIVRWMAETPAGWVGAWDREALKQFTHPPRREWRGLTEEEIYPLYSEPSSDAEMVEFARAIEAALKERNV